MPTASEEQKIHAFLAQAAEEQYTQLIESAAVEAIPRDGAEAMNVNQPGDPGPFPDAVYMADLFYTADTGTNDILWTLRMKNGDTLLLRQVIVAIPRPLLTYFPEDEPMETIEELQALLDRIAAEEPENASVILYLPPVRYTGGLELDKRSFTFYGSSDGATTTTFTGPLRLRATSPDFITLRDLRVEGDGTGTGVFASAGVAMFNCTVTGWEVGAQIVNGGFLTPQDCTFEENGIGASYNTHESNLTADTFENVTFRNNRVGLLITDLPTPDLRLENAQFTGNETDIQNDSDVVVEQLTVEEEDED